MLWDLGGEVGDAGGRRVAGRGVDGRMGSFQGIRGTGPIVILSGRDGKRLPAVWDCLDMVFGDTVPTSQVG